MEKTGLERALQKIKDKGLEISRYCHDNDGTARNLIAEYFPNAKEQLCVHHAAKSLMKGIITLSKEEEQCKVSNNNIIII